MMIRLIQKVPVVKVVLIVRSQQTEVKINHQPDLPGESNPNLHQGLGVSVQCIKALVPMLVFRIEKFENEAAEMGKSSFK